jgi:hypothetical protein
MSEVTGQTAEVMRWFTAILVSKFLIRAVARAAAGDQNATPDESGHHFCLLPSKPSVKRRHLRVMASPGRHPGYEDVAV